MEKPRDGTCVRVLIQWLAVSAVPPLSVSLYFTHVLCVTTLEEGAAPHLLFNGLQELLGSLTHNLEFHRQHVPAPDQAVSLVSRNIGCSFSGQMRALIFFFFFLPSFQLEPSTPNLSVAVKRIVLRISELLEAV